MSAELTEFLGQPARVEVSDGRVIAGLLMCIDHSQNLILNQSVELRAAVPEGEPRDGPILGVNEAGVLRLGDVLIPGKQLLSLQVIPLK